MSAARPVPRNIDKPNRNAEYALVALVGYFGTKFVSDSAFAAIIVAIAAVYLVNRLTANKPEGAAFRFMYRYLKIGRFIPPPRYVDKFEI